MQHKFSDDDDDEFSDDAIVVDICRTGATLYAHGSIFRSSQLLIETFLYSN